MEQDYYYEEKVKSFYQKKILPNLNKVVIGLLVVGFLLLGLFSAQPGLYYFGFVFFLAGFYAGAYGPKVFGLIFVFSHGGTGLSLMIYYLCSKYFDNPRFTDGPYLIRYAGIVVFLIIAATVCVFVCNLTNPFLDVNAEKKIAHKNKWYVVLPLGLYFLAVLLTVVFLRII